MPHTMLRRLLLLCALSAFPTLTLNQAFADTASETMIREGLDLRRAGRDLDALPKFEKAYGMDPTPRAAAQLGLCLQALGRWADADAKLGEALTAVNDKWVKANKAILKSSSEETKAHVGRIEIIGSPAGAEVLVAGKVVGTLPLAKPVSVDEGQVDIECHAAGYATDTRQIRIAGGQYQRLVVRLVQSGTSAANAAATASGEHDAPLELKQSQQRSEAPSSHTWIWVLATAGAVALITSVVLLSSRDSTKDVAFDQKETF